MTNRPTQAGIEGLLQDMGETCTATQYELSNGELHITEDNAEPGDYVCGDCDRIERDPMFLDIETCSKCGELIEALS